MPVLAEPLTYCNLLLVLTKFQNIPRQASLVAASVLCKVKPLPTAKFSKIMLFFEHKEHCLHPLLVDLVVWMAMKVPKGPASIVQGELLKDSLQQGMNRLFWCTSERIQTSEPVALTYIYIELLWHIVGQEFYEDLWGWHDLMMPCACQAQAGDNSRIGQANIINPSLKDQQIILEWSKSKHL